MKIGVGLPSIIPEATGRHVVDWGREAEQLGFAALGTIGRLTYPALEELIALAAVAAVTNRIELVTNVLIGPARDPVELAKQAASVDSISGGRLILGLGPGWREDDFIVTGRDFHTRGRRFDEDLEVMAIAWAGERVRGSWKAVSPRPANGRSVPIIFGGTVDAAFQRTAKWGVGWTSGGAPAAVAAQGYEKTRKAWSEAGRDGEPRLFALAYYGYGSDARVAAASYLGDYYGEHGLGMAQSMPVTPDELRATARAFEEAGTETLIFVPTAARIDQLRGLAEAVLGS